MTLDQLISEEFKKSKIFCARHNKAEILAALANPINLELKQQMANSLDEEYLESNIDDANAEEITDANAEEITDANVEENADDSQTDDQNSLGEEDDTAQVSEDNSNDSDSKDSEDVDVNSEDSSEDIESSQELSVIDIDSLRNILEGSESTKDINYIQVRPQDDTNEVWIAYHDDTAVNDIIADIISIVGEHYPDWQFNRVARTYNAIVFSYNNEDSLDVIE